MAETHSLDESSEKVFAEVRTHKAMPLLEIAAATGIRGDALEGTVKDLEDRNLVVVQGTDPVNKIVTVSGKYY